MSSMEYAISVMKNVLNNRKFIQMLCSCCRREFGTI